MDLNAFLFLAALVVFAFGCRTFENRYVQKLGFIALLVACYLTGWLLTGSHLAGVAGVLMWFLLPWLEIAGRVRQLRFPMENKISSRFPPSRDLFPELDALTAEVEKEGFEEAEDAGWKWQDTDHFLRLLYHNEQRIQATIALAQQGEMAFSYVSLTSRTEDGRSFISSNYPFSPTMTLSPNQRMNRIPHADSFEDLLAEHGRFLTECGVVPADCVEMDTEELPTELERDMVVQIDHNISSGLIEPLGDGEFRYSWRGCFYLWFQVVKDMLRV